MVLSGPRNVGSGVLLVKGRAICQNIKMDQIVAKVTGGGRIVIPASIRKSLNIDVGDEVILRVKEGEVILMSRKDALTRAQKLIRTRVKADRSLVDELLLERRKEGSH